MASGRFVVFKAMVLGYCKSSNSSLASRIKTLLVRAVFASYYLKLSPPVFLYCFLIFAKFNPHVSYKHFSYLKDMCRSWSSKHDENRLGGGSVFLSQHRNQ